MMMLESDAHSPSELNRLDKLNQLENKLFYYIILLMTTNLLCYWKLFPITMQAGETPHRCDFCSKTFTRKEHLLNHVRQHTGESPHRCTYCPKTFTRKEHLTNHIHQHTGEATSFQWLIMYGNLQETHAHKASQGTYAPASRVNRRTVAVHVEPCDLCV